VEQEAEGSRAGQRRDFINERRELPTSAPSLFAASGGAATAGDAGAGVVRGRALGTS
jgi:hypothetical protein